VKASVGSLLIVGVLKGAAFFATDLARCIDNELLEMDWTTVSSYGAGTQTSGVVRMLADTAIPVSGRDVLIVDDVCDSGLTLEWMGRHLRSKGARTVEASVLVEKVPKRAANSRPKYVGFEMGDEYIVGYGLDINQRFRQLRDIHALEVGVQ
jgi:hypoxanthine phosphoribosyltransferase